MLYLYQVKGIQNKIKSEEEMKMKRYGEEFTLTQELMDTIATYMDDEVREDVHCELAPCSPEEFLERYLELDPDFADLLSGEFGIEA